MEENTQPSAQKMGISTVRSCMEADGGESDDEDDEIQPMAIGLEPPEMERLHHALNNMRVGIEA